MSFIETLQEDKTPRIATGFIPIGEDAMGEKVQLPYIYVQGSSTGKTMVLTAGLHGDELHGQKVIHEVVNSIDVTTFSGSLICFPICNIPGFIRRDRYFSDGMDLNHIMGIPQRKLPSHSYQAALLEQILIPCDVFIDLHSERKNLHSCVFAYADLTDEHVTAFTKILTIDGIINHPASKTTLRGQCKEKNIPCITIEVGNALSCDMSKVNQCKEGIMHILEGTNPLAEPVVFEKTIWQMASKGGYTTLTVKPLQTVNACDEIGTVSDVFGNKNHTYSAEKSGLILGVNSFPLVEKGDKLIHIAILNK